MLLGGKGSYCLLRWCVSSILVFMLLGLAAVAQKPKTNPLAPESETRKSETPSQGLEQNAKAAHELTQSDLEAFLEGIVPLQLAREDIAGAVIAVVKDGKPFFAKGYGYSNVENNILVSVYA